MDEACDIEFHAARGVGDRGRLRIAMIAPPWIPVPPAGYGGIESVVSILCEVLVRRGHRVTLFAAPGSTSSAQVRPVLPHPHPEAIERALYEVDHVARAFAMIEQGGGGDPFDVVHDHCGYTVVAMADRIATPVVHTLHGPFSDENRDFYRHHRDKARFVALSAAQRSAAPNGFQVASIVPNAVDPAAWTFQARKQDHLLWIGRMHETKGAHRAIAAAREANRRLLLAGPVQPGQEHYFRESVQPHIDGDRVIYLGEVGGRLRRDLFAAAAGLLMPITWSEPFGLVMTEALVSGTPVIAFAQGAATEIVKPGLNGFLAADEHEMARLVSRLGSIDAAYCRADAVRRFGPEQMADGYERVYRDAVAGQAKRGAPPPLRLSGLRRAVGTPTAARAASPSEALPSLGGGVD